MVNSLEENTIDQDQINIINELPIPRATSLEAEMTKAVRLLKNRMGYLHESIRVVVETTTSIPSLEKLCLLARDIVMFQIPYVSVHSPIPVVPTYLFVNKLRFWTDELKSYHSLVSGKISGKSFFSHENYLYSPAVQRRMSRGRDDISKLLTNFLSIEELLTKNEQEFIEEKPQTDDIPDQVESPIMTDIINDTLVTKRGRLIQPTVPVGDTTDYLIKQTRKIMDDLNNSNIDKRIVLVFSEIEDLLSEWSVDKVLSLGAHLELIDAVKKDINGDEVASIVLARINVFCNNLRLFVNNFDAWHLYVRQSVEFAIEA